MQFNQFPIMSMGALLPWQPNQEAEHIILATLNCSYQSNICTKLSPTASVVLEMTLKKKSFFF